MKHERQILWGDALFLAHKRLELLCTVIVSIPYSDIPPVTDT